MEKKIEHLIIDDTGYETEIPEGYIRKGNKEPVRPGEIRAAIPGVITDIKVRKGQMVAAGDIVVILEAMKMLNAIEAETAGRVSDILVAAGDRVAKGQMLIRMD